MKNKRSQKVTAAIDQCLPTHIYEQSQRVDKLSDSKSKQYIRMALNENNTSFLVTHHTLNNDGPKFNEGVRQN